MLFSGERNHSIATPSYLICRGISFPSSCFLQAEDYKYYTNGKHDMLKKIFGLLGTPEQKALLLAVKTAAANVWTVRTLTLASSARMPNVTSRKLSLELLQRSVQTHCKLVPRLHRLFPKAGWRRSTKSL